MPKNVTPDVALDRLMALCARSEQCSHDVRQKLRNWGLDQSQIEAVVETLIDRRYVDDNRFARAFVNDKTRLALWGPRKIFAALLRHHIPAALIRRHLDAIDPAVIDSNLLHILRAKARTIDEPCTFDGRTRLFRYALSRGYDPEAIARILRANFVKPNP